MTKVHVENHNGEFVLRTGLGFKVGSRMYSVAPEEGREYPPILENCTNKLAADRAALRWNLYLKHAEKCRSKTKTRISE